MGDYRNPHFQPFFNHRTRPPQIHQLRTVFTPTHTITHRYTPLHTHRSPHTRTPHRCTHDISVQLLDLHVSILKIYVVTYAVTETTCLDLRNYSVTYVDYPHPLRAPTPFKGWGPFLLTHTSRNLTCAYSRMYSLPLASQSS